MESDRGLQSGRHYNADHALEETAMMMHKRTRRRSARRAGAGQRYLVPFRAGGPFGAMMDEQLMLTFLDTHGPTLLAVGGALGGVWTVARFGLALLRDPDAWLVDRAAGR